GPMNPHTERAVILAGSNVDRDRCLPEAVRLLRRRTDLVVEAVSECFDTVAVGADDAPDFYNAAVLVDTSLEPESLRDVLRGIEDELGRLRTDDPNAPRTIDLDIIFYGDLVKDFDGWSIPDPEIEMHPHIAVPVADVAPDWVHPVSGRTAAEIAAGMGPGVDRMPARAGRFSSPYVARASGFDDSVEVYAPRLEELVRAQLTELGEDPEREGLRRTPLRVAKALDYLTSGYTTSVDEVVNGAIFDAEGAEEMVVVRDVEFYSMCEHHMLPFFGNATVAYLPKGKIIGLSKIARIVDVFARRLQVQERLTNQVADAMTDILDPHGVGVVMEGKHLCMMMRGVQKQESNMVTSSMRGTFRSDPRTRSEFLDLVR
ncbi:MAG: GTP cyclohydrolase I FolE, partial [Acidimicrobiia bacterium]|nr:GTP cyclohydrolase I FolE [Acidimicrobiia bacterium]